MKLCPLLRSFSALLLIAVSLAPTAARAQDDAGLTVFAAASLKDALDDAAAAYR